MFVLLTFYKKEMAAMLTDTLKKSYGLTLKVEDVNVSFFDNWPHASVKLTNIYVSNDSTGKSEPLLKSGNVSLSFNLEKLLKKQFSVRSVSIDNANINMIKFKDGTKNFQFKPQPQTKSAPSTISFEIGKISIKNTTFNFTNLEKEQHINIDFVDETIRLKHYTDGIDIKLNGKVLVGELLFNAKKGAFLKHTPATLSLDIDYFKNEKVLCIHEPSYIEIENQHYEVASLIHTGEQKRLALFIENKNIWYEKAARLLTPKIQKTLSNFEIKKPFHANVLIVTNIGKKEEPILIVNVDGKNSDLTIGNSKIPYSNVLFNGKIISIDKSRQHGNGEEGKVIFKPIIGKLYDFPFTASLTVSNLVDPYIKIDAGIYIEASKINSKINKEFILKGACSAKLTYSGPTNKLNKQDFLGKDMHLDATLFFNDLAYSEMVRPYRYVVKGKARMNNKDLKFEDLLLKTDGGNALLKGSAEGFVNYIFGYTNTLKASIQAKTESLNLNPYLSGSAEKIVDTEVPEQKDQKSYKEKLQANDQSKFEFNITLAAKKLFVKNVEATNANIDVFYRTNFLNIRSASMNTCEGRITAKGTMEDFNKINSEMSVQDVNVTMLFKEFDNFKQKAIVSDNLQGTISLDARFKTHLSDSMTVMGETMIGDVKLKLKEGHIINFEPVQNLSNFIFRNRDFNDVRFTELNETFRIRGYEMEIEELEIASNVLNLFIVDGVYNFKGNSNLNLLIPWSNLKRRGKNYIPKSSGETAENTKGLKLNVAGPANKMKISLGHKDPKRNT